MSPTLERVVVVCRENASYELPSWVRECSIQAPIQPRRRASPNGHWHLNSLGAPHRNEQFVLACPKRSKAYAHHMRSRDC